MFMKYRTSDVISNNRAVNPKCWMANVKYVLSCVIKISLLGVREGRASKQITYLFPDEKRRGASRNFIYFCIILDYYIFNRCYISC